MERTYLPGPARRQGRWSLGENSLERHTGDTVYIFVARLIFVLRAETETLGLKELEVFISKLLQIVDSVCDEGALPPRVRLPDERSSTGEKYSTPR